jgi:hypothetical protein
MPYAATATRAAVPLTVSPGRPRPAVPVISVAAHSAAARARCIAIGWDHAARIHMRRALMAVRAIQAHAGAQRMPTEHYAGLASAKWESELLLGDRDTVEALGNGIGRLGR